MAHETLRDRARAMAQMRAIWHCEIFDTTPSRQRRTNSLETTCRQSSGSNQPDRNNLEPGSEQASSVRACKDVTDSLGARTASKVSDYRTNADEDDGNRPTVAVGLGEMRARIGQPAHTAVMRNGQSTANRFAYTVSCQIRRSAK